MALDRQFQLREKEVAAEAYFLKQSAGIDRRAALLDWRRDAYELLLDTLTWPEAPDRRHKLVNQCIAELETMAQQLYSRGWLVKHAVLMALAKQAIEPVAVAQRAGKIGDFWPYFRASVRRFVPVNADQIQQDARRAGADSTHTAAELLASLVGVLTTRQVSPVEVIGERRAEAAQEGCKPAAKRGRPPKFKASAEATGDLFGGV